MQSIFFASNCFAHCDMHYVDRDTLSWILLSNEPFATIGLFRKKNYSPSLFFKKSSELLLHILFNTLAHLPTPFPSPMSIDEYFEITLKSPSVSNSKTWKTVFTVEISFSFLAEKCKQIIRIYAKWEQIQIRAQVHWKVVSSARFSRQVGFKIDRKINILRLKLLYLEPTSIFEKFNQSNSNSKKKICTGFN